MTINILLSECPFDSSQITRDISERPNWKDVWITFSFGINTFLLGWFSTFWQKSPIKDIKCEKLTSLELQNWIKVFLNVLQLLFQESKPWKFEIANTRAVRALNEFQCSVFCAVRNIHFECFLCIVLILRLFYSFSFCSLAKITLMSRVRWHWWWLLYYFFVIVQCVW